MGNKSKIYRTRRGLLIAVADYVNPVDLDYVIDHPALLDVSRDEAVVQWKNLIENGFLQGLPGSKGEYVTISPEGRKNLPEAPREGYSPYIWSPTIGV